MNTLPEIKIDITLIKQSDEAIENFDDEFKDTAFCFTGPKIIQN